QNIGITTRSVAAGLRAGWKAFVTERQTAETQPSLPKRRSRPPLPTSSKAPLPEASVSRQVRKPQTR
ncbi:MAG: hypothetical protein AAFX40_08805, partial [Cyanobacteria bacterium J06639_1]